MKRVMLFTTLAVLVGLALAAGATARSSSVPWQPTLDLRFEAVGCHSWSLGGDPYAVEQTVRLHVGESLVIANHDFSTHTLIETSGGALALFAQPAAPRLRHVQVLGHSEDESPALAGRVATGPAMEVGSMPFGSSLRVTFQELGRYELTTHEGDSLFPGGLPAFGADNQLLLHVQVVPDHHYPPE